MNRFQTLLTTAGAGLLALGLAFAATAAGPDGSITSLRGPVAVDSANAKPELHGVEEGKAFDRAYRQQPPLIPHRIDKYEVDLKTNQCLSCHDWPFNTEYGAPKVSETHYIDRQGNRLDDVARTRWFCTQCHVPQMDAPALVENTFEPARD
jgi:cytochrome c-type protein NapB